MWKNDRVAEGRCLENTRAQKGTAGSNPASSVLQKGEKYENYKNNV